MSPLDCSGMPVLVIWIIIHCHLYIIVFTVCYPISKIHILLNTVHPVWNPNSVGRLLVMAVWLTTRPHQHMGRFLLVIGVLSAWSLLMRDELSVYKVIMVKPAIWSSPVLILALYLVSVLPPRRLSLLNGLIRFSTVSLTNCIIYIRQCLLIMVVNLDVVVISSVSLLNIVIIWSSVAQTKVVWMVLVSVQIRLLVMPFALCSVWPVWIWSFGTLHSITSFAFTICFLMVIANSKEHLGRSELIRVGWSSFRK